VLMSAMWPIGTMKEGRPLWALAAALLLLLAAAPAPAAATGVFDGSGFEGMAPPIQTPGGPAPVPNCTTYWCACSAPAPWRFAPATRTCAIIEAWVMVICPFCGAAACCAGLQLHPQCRFSACRSAVSLLTGIVCAYIVMQCPATCSSAPTGTRWR